MTTHPAAHRTPDTPSGPELELVRCIGPHQITEVGMTADDTLVVTVTEPPGSTTVLSCQPGGTFTLVEAGTAGAYERALLLPDRLVYAPLGAQGAAYVLPYTDKIPNV